MNKGKIPDYIMIRLGIIGIKLIKIGKRVKCLNKNPRNNYI